MGKLVITVRERGKLVTTRETHNIWTNTGRTYLTKLLSYATLGPYDAYFPTFTTETDHRLRYIGFGIGGDKQIAPTIADSVNLLAHYPYGVRGLSSSTDPTVLQLERPVRFAWSTALPVPPAGVYPPFLYNSNDEWLREVSGPATHPTATSTEVGVVLAYPDMVAATLFPVVPISEIGLFTNAANLNYYASAPVAYATFESIQVTTNPDVVMTVSWTVRF